MTGPFPKFVSIVAILAAVFGALNVTAVLALVSPQIGGVIAAIATVAAALTHSLGGTGGRR